MSLFSRIRDAGFAPTLLTIIMAWPVDGSAEDATTLPAVTVTGNYDNGVGTSDAASEGSVDGKLIENRPVLRTGELLEFVPGLIVTQHSGDGKANQYYLRGFNLDHGTDFATFVDGMPVNMRTHAHGQGYSDLNYVIPELVSRIDYRKGPYRADDGDFASAGSARLRLIDRVDQGLANVTVGENGYARGVLVDAIALGSGRLLYAVEAGHNNGPWTLAEHGRRASGVLRYADGDSQNGWSITAMGYGATWRSTDQVPARAVDTGLIDRFGAIDDSDGGRTSRASLSFDRVSTNALGTLRANAYAIASRLDLYSNFTYYLDDPVNGDQFEQTESRRTYGANVSQSFAFRVATFEFDNTVGLQTRFDHIDPIALYRDVDRERIATTRESRVNEGSAGLFIESRVRWNDWLRSVAGARYDAYRFRVNDALDANSGKVDARIGSPKLALVFGPWAKTEFFVDYGQGFHSNDARGTTTTVSPSDGSAQERAQPLVKTRGEEIGVRSELVPGLQSSLALWRLALASELVFSGDAGDTEVSRASRRHGVEINHHYVALPWLLFDLDLAWSKARYVQDDPAGNHIPGSIAKVASFGVSVLERGPWFGHFQLRYFGPRPLIEDDSVRSASTTLASARVGYAVGRTLKISMDVFNLFNRKNSDIDYFYASRLPGEPANGVDDVHFHPVEPRTVRVSVSARF